MKCNICGSEKGFKNDHQGALRENLCCKNCGSTSRDRAYIWGLGFAKKLETVPLCDWPIEKECRIFETSGYRAHPKYLEEKFDYYNPKFDDAPHYLRNDPKEYADIENLLYDYNFFDHVISSDVFEHVRQDVVGFENIYNVLKSKGHFVLTAPLFLGMPENEVRVKLGKTHKEDTEIYKNFFHSGDSLVYRLYGLEILNQLNHLNFYSVIINLQNYEFGISAQEVVVSRKEQPLELERIYDNSEVTVVKNSLQENA